LKRTLFLLALGLAGAWITRTYFIETVSVASGSMEPTLFLNTHYLVNRIVYRLHEPERGDIIVFTSPVDHKTGYIKRVIAVGGDRVELRAKQVILNGTPLEEPFTIHKRANVNLVGDTLQEITVPDHDVFVLGDNRDESDDSSVWKDPQTGQRIYFVKTQDIKGRLIRIP
jgi:signal peptidase I